MSACIGEPISWLRLERYALDGGADRAAAAHLARCAACARCLDEIRGDLVALPPLVWLAAGIGISASTHNGAPSSAARAVCILIVHHPHGRHEGDGFVLPPLATGIPRRSAAAGRPMVRSHYSIDTDAATHQPMATMRVSGSPVEV
jgi:hypothetical protein